MRIAINVFFVNKKNTLPIRESLWSRFVLFTSVAILFSLTASAQPCLIPIVNNSISTQAATCANTVATLRGSTPIGGTGTYSYQWEKTNGGCGIANFFPIAGATNRDYAVPIGTPVNDCFRRIVTSGTCTSTSNSLQVPNGDRTTPAAPSAATTASGCTTASGTITVSNPAPAAGTTYSIDGTTYTNTTGVFTLLVPGTYSVSARLPAGCISPVRTVIVGQTTTPTGTITPSSANICAGSDRVLTVNGGNSYQWYRDGVAIPGATSNTYTAMLAGTYTVEIFNGVCRGTASNSSVITVTPLPTGNITPASGAVCPNGSILLSVNGGTSYQWFKNGQPINGATSSTYSATEAATYTVIITSNSCSNPANNSVVITQAVAPSGFITPATATLCPGGTISLTTVTAGGVNTFQWFRNGQLINGATNATLTITQAGTYNVIIFNSTCNAGASNIVSISDAPAINFTPATTQPNCTSTTGSIAVNAVTGGGSSNYSYSINNGASFQPGNSFSNLSPATYQVVVRDTAGCVSSPRAVSITAFVPTLAGTANVGNITCTQPSGTVSITASGGTSPYQYSLDGGPFGSPNSFQNLVLGAHNAVIRDAAGCTATVNFSVAQTGSTLQATFTKTDARCGVANGTVVITATGGTAPFQYSLNGQAYQSPNTFNNLGGGSYKVTTKDAANCVYDVFFTLTQSGTSPNVIINRPDTICPLATANLTLPAVTAGSDNGLVFTYWRDTMTTVILTNPAAATPGKYFIKGTSSAGCATIRAVVVNKFNFTAGNVSYSGPQVPCLGATLILTATPGRAYQWYRNDTVIAGATAMTYNVTRSGSYWVAISNDTCFVPSANRYNFLLADCNLPDVFVPTGFTPNKNGANDVLRPIFYKIDTLTSFKVYNRWGQLVFQTAEKGTGWDGTLKGVSQPSETYTWIVECRDTFGNPIKKSGRSLLIR